MVILEKILLRNWHAFADNQFDLSEWSTLITGMNASGKTTLLDAISVILDGANANDFNIAVKDEGERRTISGALHYVSSGVPRRNGKVTGLILAQFQDQSYKTRFLNGVFFRSKSFTSDASVTQHFFSVINCSIDQKDFQINFETCKIPGQIDYPNKKTAFEEFFRLRKMQPIRPDQYKGLMNSVLRAKLDGTPAEFVKKNILPEDDKVASIASVKQHYKLLEERENLYKDLSLEAQALQKVKENWDQLKQKELEYSLCVLAKKQCVNEQTEKTLRQVEALDHEMDEYKKKKTQLEETLTQLNEKAGEYKSADLLTGKRKELAVINRELITLKTEFDRVNNWIFSINSLAKLIPSKQVYSIESTKEEVSELLELAKKKANQLEERLDEEKETQRSLKKDLMLTAADLTALKKGTFTVSGSTGISHKLTAAKELAKAINEAFIANHIDDRASLLYEGITSIGDRSWQPAIERLMGIRRLHLVVKPEYETIAIRIQNEMTLTGDTDIILSSRFNEVLPKPNSAASIIQTEEETQRKIINYFYGNYILCDTIEAYQANERSIMKNGMVKHQIASHKTANVLSNEVLLIGTKAGKNEILKAEAKLKEQSEKEQALSDQMSEMNRKKRALDTLVIQIKASVPTSPKIQTDYQMKLKARDEVKEEIETLSKSSGNQRLLDEIERNRKEMKEKILHLDKTYEMKLAEKAQEKSELKAFECMKLEIEKQILLLPRTETLERRQISSFYDSLEEKSTDEIAKRQAAALSKGKNASNQLKLSQTEYNLKFHKDFKVGAEAESYALYQKRFDYLESKSFTQIGEEIKRLKESLTENKSGVFRGLAESFLFAKEEVEKINAILKNYEISGNKFKLQLGASFRKKHLYEAILHFSREEKPDAAIIEPLNEWFEQMLHASDAAQFEEFADYRNYLDCDVLISQEETNTWSSFSSEKGNFSGGQKETPYYMCLAAALSCKAYTKGGLRLIVLDEAFKNMDAINKVKALSMFKNLNLQVLLFTSNSDLSDCTEHIYVITKYDNRIVTAFGKNGMALKIIDKRLKE